MGGGVKVFAALAAIWTVYAAAFSTEDVLSLTITFLALMLVLTFLLIGPTPRSDRHRVAWFDWPLSGASAACGIYFLTQADTISQRITLLDPLTA